MFKCLENDKTYEKYVLEVKICALVFSAFPLSILCFDNNLVS